VKYINKFIFKIKSLAWNGFAYLLVLLGLARREKNTAAFSSDEEFTRQWFRHRQFSDFLAQNGLLKGKLLDVGCGKMDLLRRISLQAKGACELNGCDWIPVDKNPKIDEIPYRQVDLNNDGLKSFEDASYDIIIASEVFEHLENPSSILREINKKLKPNGHLVFSIPNAVNLYERYQFLFTGNSHRYQIEKPNEFGHITFYTKNIIVSLCNRTGFRLIKEGTGYFYISGYFFLPRIQFSSLFSYSATYCLRKERDV
jgi:SAM-dependent methyltransferase